MPGGAARPRQDFPLQQAHVLPELVSSGMAGGGSLSGCLVAVVSESLEAKRLHVRLRWLHVFS